MRSPNAHTNNARQLGDIHGRRTVHRRPVAKLTDAVVAPTPHGALAKERASRASTEADQGDIGEAAHASGRGTHRLCSVSELSGTIVAPALDGAVGQPTPMRDAHANPPLVPPEYPSGQLQS
jgi:hypothetical protein